MYYMEMLQVCVRRVWLGVIHGDVTSVRAPWLSRCYVLKCFKYYDLN